MAQFIAYSIGVFLVVIILLVIILLVAKKYLSPSGNVNITVNGDKVLNVPQGNNLMATLNQNGRPAAASVRFRCLRAVARFSILRSLTSPVNRSRTIGASAVSAR